MEESIVPSIRVESLHDHEKRETPEWVLKLLHLLLRCSASYCSEQGQMRSVAPSGQNRRYTPPLPPAPWTSRGDVQEPGCHSIFSNIYLNIFKSPIFCGQLFFLKNYVFTIPKSTFTLTDSLQNYAIALQPVYLTKFRLFWVQLKTLDPINK